MYYYIPSFSLCAPEVGLCGHDTPPCLVGNEIFWRTRCAETPKTELLRFPCVETPVVEFLRFPCAAILHRALQGTRFSGAPGAQKLQKRRRNFTEWSFCGSRAQRYSTGNGVLATVLKTAGSGVSEENAKYFFRK